MLMALSQQIQKAKFRHQTSLMEFKIHTLKTNSKCKTLTICLHYIECVIKEDQRQKIRELDFGKSSSQAPAQFDINVIKGSGCYKCGSNDHFIKDCPLNREKDSDLPLGQQKHYNDYRSKSHDENSIEK